MLGDAQGNLTQLEIEDNTLALKDGDTKARGTGNKRLLDVETVIFAIGDKVDESFGLPVEWNEFVKSATPKFPIYGVSFESTIEGVFVGGWSRKASEGLVGYARKDGVNAAKAVTQYLQTLSPSEPNIDAVAERVQSLGKPIIMKDDVKRLEAIEAEEAKKRGLEEFKFDSNEDMLTAMGMTMTA
jgi:ferredoxin--NADP+ reductase